jgi:hypothetical protein
MVENLVLGSDGTIGVQDQVRDEYVPNRTARDRYEATPNAAEDTQKELLREQTTPIIEQEAKAIANDQKSLLGEIGEFGGNVVKGALQGAIAEPIQTLGGPDKLFGFKDPVDFGDQLARGVGQATAFFIPVGGAVKAGFKLANLFQKHGQLSKAGRWVSNATAGALTDIFAFDQKDPLIGDLAFSLGVVSKDSMVGHAVDTFLTQKDADDKTIASAKAALSGLLAGAGVDLLVKGSGLIRKSLPKGTKEAVKESSDNLVERLDKIRAEGDPSKIDPIREVLPDEDTARRQRAESFNNDPRRVFEDEEGNFKGIPPEIEEMLTKLGNGESIPDQHLDELVSMNFLKSAASDDINNTLQFFSRFMKVKEIAKPSVATADLDTVVPSMLQDFISGTDEQIQSITKTIIEKTGGIREAIPLVGTIRALNAIQLRKLTQLNTEFALNPSKANMKKRLKGYELQSTLLFEGAGMSKASSDLLRAHAKTGPAIGNPDIVKGAVSERFLQPVVEVQRTAAGHASKLDRIHKKELAEAKAQAKGLDPEVRIDDDASSLLEVTGKVGKGRKRKVTINVFKETPTGKRIGTYIKGLQSTLRNLNSPQRGTPFPKKKPIKDVATPEQLAEIGSIKARIKKVKADRDTLYNKFKKNAKPQLKLRKTFEKLSKDIEKLQDDINPRAATKAQRDQITTPEIETLKAERKKLLAKLKPLDNDERVLQQLNDEFSDLLVKRMNKDFGTITKVEKEVIGRDIREAIKREKERAKSAIKNAEIEEAFSLRASALELEDIDKMNFSQMRTRLAAMDRGFTARSYRALSEIYINGLLSSAKTVAVVNPMGTASSIISSIFERSLAALRTTATGKGDVDFKEVIILSWNYMAGLPDFFRVMGKALRHGPSDPNFKLDYMNVTDRGISKEAFNIGGNLGKAVDYVGTAVNLPGKLLISTDEAFKALINRAERRALAYRKARNEFNLDGSLQNKANIQKRTDDILNNLDKHPDIIEQARASGDINTFTNVLPDRIVKDAFGKEHSVPGVAKTIKNFIDQRDPTGISRIFVPFFQTPANIFNFTFERTPLINKYSNSLKQELKSTVPGVRELAEARMASAWLIWGSLATLAYQGNFTGAPPRDPNLRRSLEASMGGRGWWSADFGNGLKSYDKFDPFGLILSSSAIIGNMAKALTNLSGQYVRGDASDAIAEKYEEVLMAGVVGLAELIKNKTFLSSVGELVDVFSSDGRSTNNTLRKLVSFDPRVSLYSSFRRDVTRYMNPNRPERIQQVESEGDTLFEKTLNSVVNEISIISQEAQDSVMFGWGNRFPMKDLAGNVVQYPGTNQELDATLGMVDKMLNAINKPVVKSKSPLINKLAELESRIGQPSALDKVHGVLLTDEEKAFTIDVWTKANKTLDKFVVTKGFNTMPGELQLKVLDIVISQNKRNAIEAAKKKFSRLKEATREVKSNNILRLTQDTVQGFQPSSNIGQQ